MPTDPPAWRIAVHDAATTLSPAFDRVIAFDLEGRPVSWFDAGTTYKRSLASEVVGRRAGTNGRDRWTLDPAEAMNRFEQARATALQASAAFDGGDLPVPSGHAERFAERLNRILDWTPETLCAEHARYAAAYRPIPILPPDQYGAIVVQASFGCSWNRCTFCSFYQDRPFEVRSEHAFEEHLGAVAGLLGRSAAGRRSIFLADGNALVLSNRRLEPMFSAARTHFPDRPFAGFVDVFSGERKSQDAWRELRSWGLKRVALGVETGHDPLLAFLNKPGGTDATLAFVSSLKQAGLQVAVILMVGAGGPRYARGHVQDTTRLLARLPLDADDIVYLSPFVRHTGSQYDTRAQAGDLRDLTPSELADQEQALREAARREAPDARVARYLIDEFIY